MSPNSQLSQHSTATLPSRVDPTLSLLENLSSQTPTNQYRLPEGYYRCDLITPSESGQGSTSGLVSNSKAYVVLDYSEGYPVVPGGAPFWYQLPHEGILEFEVFQYYLALPKIKESTRVLYDLPEVVPQETLQSTPYTLNELKILYYWEPRARAYDAYDTMVRRRQRSALANVSEDRHYYISEILLKKVVSFVNSDAFLEGMNTKTALEGLKLGTALQRQSLGLAPNAVSERSPQLDMQVEYHRTLMPEAASNDFHGNTKEETIVLSDGTEVVRGTPKTKISELLSNPEDLRLAERLVIKMNQKPSSPRE